MNFGRFFLARYKGSRILYDCKYEDGPRHICTFGWLVNRGSVWVGVHYSKHNKRWCINPIPCVTFWVTKPGGNVP